MEPKEEQRRYDRDAGRHGSDNGRIALQHAALYLYWDDRS
jgi:hypothetical protein